jgi:putative ABC transport system permease protein
VEGIEFVVPRNQRNGTLTNGFLSATFNVNGDYPLLDKVQKKELIYGRFINKTDIQEKRKTVVISEEAYKQLFEKESIPIGEFLQINNINFKVVGVFQNSNVGMGSDVHIPFTTFQQVFNTGNKLGWMMITGKEDADIKQIEKDSKLLLKNIHKIHPKDERAFGSFNLGERFAKVTGFLTGMQFLTWFVGIATLIAGVFAIGNILLITVKERTKEIGVRRALGATPNSIKKQIVLEAVVLAVLAGIFGIIGGGLVLMLTDKFWGQGEDAVLVNPSVSIPVVFLAVLILVVLGSLIGLIPANRATRIKPIAALNDE